jgi:CheY-like chemotaxis protein
VALTAMVAPGDQERCLRAGFDDYMSKPIHLDELSEALTAAAGWRATPKGLG